MSANAIAGLPATVPFDCTDCGQSALRNRYASKTVRCTGCQVTLRQAQNKAHTERRRGRRPSRREYHLRRQYGPDAVETRSRLHLEQGGCCKVCGVAEADSPKRRLVVDHDHATGEIRWLLCHRCNTAVGLLQDDPGLFRRGAELLDAWRNRA